jgi:hypothetical protein
MRANYIFKLTLGFICLAGFLLWISNPNLKDFKDFAPQKVYFEKEYKECDKKIHISYRKTRDYFFFSYYEVSFICSFHEFTDEHTNIYRNIWGDLLGTRIYLGIFNNFYLLTANKPNRQIH